MLSRKSIAVLCLGVLGIALAVGNYWFAAARSTIPLRLDDRVVRKLVRREKHPPRDDVCFLYLESGRRIHVDRAIFDKIRTGEQLRKRRWRRVLFVDSREIALSYSRDVHGMRWAMPGILGILAVAGLAVAGRKVASTMQWPMKTGVGWMLIGTSAVAWASGGCGSRLWQESQQETRGEDPAAPDSVLVERRRRPPADQFPEALDHWRKKSSLIAEGLVEANALRRKLLTKTASGEPFAERIVRAVSEFQRQLVGNQTDMVSIAEFRMTTDRLIRQLRGNTPLDAVRVFRAFDGRWFGLWDRTPVNHDWRSSQLFSPPQQFAGVEPRVSALQYAWIGNGFGWNYLASLDRLGNRQVILGQVYYTEAPDHLKISGSKPHVGYADLPHDGGDVTRLIWITDREVFFEQVFPQSDLTKARYAITGLYHRLLEGIPTVDANAVQAIYTRDPRNRPRFQRIRWVPPPEYLPR